MYKSVVGLRQLVHGTFMTQATWHIRTAAGRELFIKADAMAPGEAHVAKLRSVNTSVAAEAALLGSEYSSLMPWDEAIYDDVRVSTRYLTVSVQTAAWTVEVTAKPIYGLVSPLINDTHVHGRWEEDQRRLDISIRGAFPQPDAHGVVGQSYRDATRRDGAHDNYDIDSAPEKANSDGYLPAMTTSAQAEGAIDGVYTDYKLEHALSTAFAYSRFESVAQPREGPQSTRSASTTEWDGLAGSELLKRQQEGLTRHKQEVSEPGRRLSECVCDPPAGFIKPASTRSFETWHDQITPSSSFPTFSYSSYNKVWARSTGHNGGVYIVSRLFTGTTDVRVFLNGGNSDPGDYPSMNSAYGHKSLGIIWTGSDDSASLDDFVGSSTGYQSQPATQSYVAHEMNPSADYFNRKSSYQVFKCSHTYGGSPAYHFRIKVDFTAGKIYCYEGQYDQSTSTNLLLTTEADWAAVPVDNNGGAGHSIPSSLPSTKGFMIYIQNGETGVQYTLKMLGVNGLY